MELKGAPLLANVSLIGNPLTQAFYPDLEQLPEAGQSTSSHIFSLEDYERVCAIGDLELQDQRMLYRASVICQYGTTIQVLDCLKVTDEEIEGALALERKGEFLAIVSPSSSFEAVALPVSKRKESIKSSSSQVNMTYSPESSMAERSRRSLDSSHRHSIEIEDHHTRKMSATKLTFPPPLEEDPLESSIELAPRNSAVSSVSASFTVTPESCHRTSRMSITPEPHHPAHFNSMASVESSTLAQEEFNASKLKFHSSPEDQRYLYTSNLNSPNMTPQSSQRIDLKSKDEIPLQVASSSHTRSRSMPKGRLQPSTDESKRAKLIRSPLSEGAANMFNHTLNPKDRTYEASPTSLAKQFFAQTDGPSSDDIMATPGKSMTAISEHSEVFSEGPAQDYEEEQNGTLSLEEKQSSIVCESVSPFEAGAFRPFSAALMEKRRSEGTDQRQVSLRLSSSTREKIKEKEHELSEKIKRISAKARELEIDPVRTYESIQEVIESEQHSLQVSGRYGVDREFKEAYEEKLTRMKEDLKARYSEYKEMLRLVDVKGERLADSATLRKLSMDLADPLSSNIGQQLRDRSDKPPVDLNRVTTLDHRPSSRHHCSHHKDECSHHHCCRHRHRHRHSSKRQRSVPLQADTAKENQSPGRGSKVKVITMREVCTSPPHAFGGTRPLQERSMREVATSPQRPESQEPLTVEAATSPPRPPSQAQGSSCYLPPRPQKTHPKLSIEEVRLDSASLRTFSNKGSGEQLKRESISSLGSELRTIEELPPISSRQQSDASDYSYVNTLEDEDLGATFAPGLSGAKSPHFSEQLKGRTTPIRSARYPPEAAQEPRHRQNVSSESLGTSFDRPNVCRTPDSQATASRIADSFSVVSRERRSNVETTEQLVVYACTPSRPILNSEAATPIQCTISPKGTEFSLISRLMDSSGRCRTLSIKKTYTYLQQRTLHNLCSGVEIPDSYFLNREAASGQLTMLFHGGSLPQLDALCTNAQGFKGVYAGKPGDMVFSESPDIGDRYYYKMQLSGGEQLEGKKWRVLLCLAALGKCYQESESFESVARNGELYLAKVRAGDFQSVYFQPNRIYLVLYPDRAIPAYLVEYTRYY